MPTDNMYPFTVQKIPATGILTFNCNPEAYADLHNLEEACFVWGGLWMHTYRLLLRMGAEINGIAGFIEGYNRDGGETGEMYLEAKNNGDWAQIGTIPFQSTSGYEQMFTPFEFYPAINMTDFRFRTPSNCNVQNSRGYIQLTEPPANQINNQQDCEAIGCHWYNGACHLAPPLCSQLTNEPDCIRYGCYWALGGCRPMPSTCLGWLTQEDCLAHGCEWWDSSHPYDPNTCQTPGLNIVRLSMDPAEPADIYSSTPPGSYEAIFDLSSLGDLVAVYRGRGELLIRKPDGGGCITAVKCYMSTNGDPQTHLSFWEEVLCNTLYTFNDDWTGYSYTRRTGNRFIVQPHFTGYTLERVNMLLYWMAYGARGELTETSVNPNPVPSGGSTTVSATAKNIGNSGYLWIQIWTSQHGQMGPQIFLNTDETFLYSRVVGNITQDIPYEITVKSWTGSEWRLDDSVSGTIYVQGG